MLKVLRVRNFALMEDLTIVFEKGLTVITGETGAGKTMIVEAIASLCGEPMEDVVIRSSKSYAEITGIFKSSPKINDLLKKSGIEIDDEIIIRRKIERGKKQISYINDQIISLNRLKELTQELVDLVGQHENQSLFFPKNHLSLLDAYAGLKDLKKDYRNNFLEYRNLQNQLQNIVETMKEKDKHLDFLKFEINEIEKVNLQPDEEEGLTIEKNLLTSSEKRSSISNELLTILYESEENIYERLSRVKKLIDELATLDSAIIELSNKIEMLILTIDDCYRQMAAYRDKIEFSQERLDYVNSRLECITKMKKKYGKTVREINDYLINAKKELSLIETKDEEIQLIQKRIGEKERAVIEWANMLSLRRHTAAQSLRKQILRILHQLGMEKAEFDIKVSEKSLTEEGKDEVEFYISTNPGEELKQLRKVASGGEISRTTLGLKAVLSEADEIPTVIFDEVDVGIGGRIAEAIGELLAELSKRHQIICITHLPQISIFAHNHILVKKEIKGKETSTRVLKLDERMRKLEIARMLGGKEITEKTIEHAVEILQRGQKR